MFMWGFSGLMMILTQFLICLSSFCLVVSWSRSSSSLSDSSTNWQISVSLGSKYFLAVVLSFSLGILFFGQYSRMCSTVSFCLPQMRLGSGSMCLMKRMLLASLCPALHLWIAAISSSLLNWT